MAEFTTHIRWTGNRGEGTAHYRAYARTWDMQAPGKPCVSCSNDPELGGDPALYNPEDLLLSALSSCHMLWFLHLASDAGISVVAYEDRPVGEGETTPDGAGRFIAAQLRPTITLANGADPVRADQLHNEVHKYCFIARSLNFPVTYAARYRIATP